ncbi:MAG: shikimate kinase [Planctomycetes bacterium]|nr:shikimate kinase [Planctomycetota bacterium]
MADPVRIALVGPRAVGKSTVGRWLAEQRSVAFVDADVELARDRGVASAGALLAAVGEPTFRMHEERVSLALLAGHDGVVALGGGAVLSPRLRERLAASDWFVAYLSASDPVLCARVLADETERPRLTDLPLEREIAALHASRRPHYRAVAAVEVVVDGLAPGEVGQRVLDAFDLAARG